MSDSGALHARVSTIGEALVHAADVLTESLGGEVDEAAVALLYGACIATAKTAHDTAAEVARVAVDEEAVRRDAGVLMARLVEESAKFFRERFGEGGGDVFDKCVDMASQTRKTVEGKTT